MSLNKAIMSFSKERYKKVESKKQNREVFSEKTLDSTLSGGGECLFEYIENGKKVKTRISVDNGQRVNSNVKKYKFHIRNAFGYRVYIKASSRKTAQDAINAIYGRNTYTVSGSDV